MGVAKSSGAGSSPDSSDFRGHTPGDVRVGEVTPKGTPPAKKLKVKWLP